MKIKSFWNRDSKPLTPAQLAIERQLVPRLKLMSYIFLFLTFASLVFVLLISQPVQSLLSPLKEEVEQVVFPEIDFFSEELEEEELELKPEEVLNFYVVSLIFASLSIVCFWLTKMKSRELYREEPIVKEEKEEITSADP